MGRLTVESVMVPVEKGVGSEPSVERYDKITDALEVMLKNNRKRIAVRSKREVIGMIRLDDALKALGLEGDLKTKKKQSIVIHGRKITIEKP